MIKFGILCTLQIMDTAILSSSKPAQRRRVACQNEVRCKNSTF